MLVFRLERDVWVLCPGMGRERGKDSQKQLTCSELLPELCL